MLVLTGCSTQDVGSRVGDARQSAAEVESAARNVHAKQVCSSAHDDLATVGSLADRLVRDPSLRTQLGPEIGAAAGRLAATVGEASPEWRGVLDATGQLGQATREANEAAVKLAASQAVLAVRVAQAGCAVAGR